MPLFTIIETVRYEVPAETAEEAEEVFVQAGNFKEFFVAVDERVIDDPPEDEEAGE